MQQFREHADLAYFRVRLLKLQLIFVYDKHFLFTTRLSRGGGERTIAPKNSIRRFAELLGMHGHR